jgi:hypothetical protein
MEENGTEGSQQASNVVSFSTEQLLNGDKADGSSCSVGQTRSRFNFDSVSTCATVRDEEEEEGDPFSPTGSETMEEPKNLKPREKRVSDVIDCIGVCLQNASGSVDSGTPKYRVTHMLIHPHPRSS